MNQPPAHIKEAMGQLVVWALAQGADVDAGYYFECDDMSIGPVPNDTPLGGWRIEVRRTRKP